MQCAMQNKPWNLVNIILVAKSSVSFGHVVGEMEAGRTKLDAPNASYHQLIPVSVAWIV